MAGDYLCATADDHFMDVMSETCFQHDAPDLNLVVCVGDRDGIIIVAKADHRDRRRPRADLLAGIVGRGRKCHQRIQIAQQAFADRL